MAVTQNQAPTAAAPAGTGADAECYRLTAEGVAKQLQVDPAKGLTSAEAAQRLQKYGPNQLAGKQKESGFQAFLRQYGDFMQILLLATAAINQIFTGSWSTTILLVGL